MLTELATATTQARAELERAKADQQRNNADSERRSDYQHRGTVAAKASSLLSELEKQLGANIRPTLEGASSDLLNRLSEGRFTSIKLDKAYTPTVLDDGKHRPLGDLSGGEQDLVALAIRLSVSDIVGERSGVGVGFLILDEIFGSQDHSRRESILSVLRSLRGRYGQIWCISHVGGIEDVADRVLEVEVNELGVSEVL
jgi:exonuclease SbcC